MPEATSSPKIGAMLDGAFTTSWVSPRVTDRNNTLADIRADSQDSALVETALPTEPMDALARWYEVALSAGLRDANAMALATVSRDGQPSARTVFMKFIDNDGLVFYTNYESRKANEIAENPKVSALFFWPELERQVRVRGAAERISPAESLRYFVRRPRESQIGAWVSQQSRTITARSILEMKFSEMKARFAGGEIPLPSFWGGYRIRPVEVEFWQGRSGRLHDRFLYRREGETWQTERLAP